MATLAALLFDFQPYLDLLGQVLDGARRAMAADGKVGLIMNVPSDALQEAIDLLPALHETTISTQAGDHRVAAMTVVNQSVGRTLIPTLKTARARGIVASPLTTVIP